MKMLKNNYLSNCDIANKYLLTNIYSIPQIKTIKLSISLKNFAFFVDSNDFFEKKDLNIKYRTFILSFLLNSNIPFLKNVNVNTFSKNTESLNLEDFFFFIIYSEKKLLNDFLFSLFVENSENLKKVKFIYNIELISNKKDTSKIHLQIPLTSIYDISYLINSNIISTNAKEMYLNVDCIVNNKFYKNKKNIIKSIPFFWVN